MARFQERIYHEDKTEKHILTVEDVMFLAELQRELNTQPNMGNADPLYFGIAQTREIPTGIDFSDLDVIMDADGDVIARDLKELVEYLNEEDIGGIAGATYFNRSCKIEFTDGDKVGAYSIRDAFEVLNAAKIEGFNLLHIKRENRVVNDALFLTHKDCEEHLENYGYNYEDDAHAFAMTAVRSPRYERLLKLIRTVDWSKLAVSGTDPTGEN